MFLRHDNKTAVWFTSSVIENCTDESTDIRSYPQDVDKSVDIPAFVCEKTPEQPLERCEIPPEKRGFARQTAKIVHGFSTKHGGVSTLPYISDLNFGFSVGEARETTLENYRCFADTLGIRANDMICAMQTHSTRVLSVDAAFCGMGLTRAYEEVLPVLVPKEPAFSDGFDGLVSDSPGTALIVRCADCVPILFCDPENGVIGACHAGWRGTLGGIAAKTVERMCSHGASRASIRAAIGHAVGICCYEVDDAFYQTFLSALGADICAQIFRFPKGTAHSDSVKPHCDLRLCNRLLLEHCGLLSEHIDTSELCTCCNPDLFHSHRYAVRHQNGVRGLMAGCIALLP